MEAFLYSHFARNWEEDQVESSVLYFRDIGKLISRQTYEAELGIRTKDAKHTWDDITSDDSLYQAERVISGALVCDQWNKYHGLRRVLVQNDIAAAVSNGYLNRQDIQKALDEITQTAFSQRSNMDTHVPPKY